MTPAEASAALKATHAHWRSVQRFDRGQEQIDAARRHGQTLVAVVFGLTTADEDIADAKAWAEGVGRG